METINEPNGMSLFWVLFITFCFLVFVAWMAYEIFTAQTIEFDEEESINELNCCDGTCDRCTNKLCKN